MTIGLNHHRKPLGAYFRKGTNQRSALITLTSTSTVLVAGTEPFPQRKQVSIINDSSNHVYFSSREDFNISEEGVFEIFSGHQVFIIMDPDNYVELYARISDDFSNYPTTIRLLEVT